MKTLTLITGGIKSGKSHYALELARQSDISGPKYFLATAEPLDKEMKIKIAKHREERAQDFMTLEETLYLANAIEKAQREAGLIVVDCLTLWVNNLLYRLVDEPDLIKQEIKSFIDTVSFKKTNMIFVTNEVGFGLIPNSPLSRRYIDELGSLNQNLAVLCNEVIFMILGIPNHIKGSVNARVGS